MLARMRGPIVRMLGQARLVVLALRRLIRLPPGHLGRRRVASRRRWRDHVHINLGDPWLLAPAYVRGETPNANVNATFVRVQLDGGWHT